MRFREPKPRNRVGRALVAKPVGTTTRSVATSPAAAKPDAILRGRMSAITLQLPDELALRLRGREHRLPEILELGLRDISADSQAGFQGATEVLEVLASLPTPQEVMALRPSVQLSVRIAELLSKNCDSGLTAAEQQEWERYEYLEHHVRMAKTNANRRLRESAGDGRG